MTTFIKDDAITWKEAETLETWFRRMVREKKREIIVKTLEGLPEKLRKKYRDICNDERGKMKNESSKA